MHIPGLKQFIYACFVLNTNLINFSSCSPLKLHSFAADTFNYPVTLRNTSHSKSKMEFTLTTNHITDAYTLKYFSKKHPVCFLSASYSNIWDKDIIQLYLRVFDDIRLQGSVVFDGTELLRYWTKYAPCWMSETVNTAEGRLKLFTLTEQRLPAC